MGRVSFTPKLTPEQKAASHALDARYYSNRAKYRKYDNQRAALTAEDLRQEKIHKSPLSRDWYRDAELYGDADTNGFPNQHNQLLNLAIRGRSLELFGNLEEEESWEILGIAATRNGHRDRLGGDKWVVTLMRGTSYAEENHKDTTGFLRPERNLLRRGEISTSTVLPLENVLCSVQATRVQQLVAYGMGTDVTELDAKLGYALIEACILEGTTQLDHSLRVISLPFGWKSTAQPRKHLKKLEKAGWFRIDWGTSYRKGQKAQSLTIYLDLDRFPDEPVETPVIDLNQYKDLAKGFKAAIRVRVNEETAKHKKYLQETDTSSLPYEPVEANKINKNKPTLVSTTPEAKNQPQITQQTPERVSPVLASKFVDDFKRQFPQIDWGKEK